MAADDAKARLLTVPGVVRVDADYVLHVMTTIDSDSEDLRNAICDVELTLINAHPSIEFDFNIRKEAV